MSADPRVHIGVAAWVVQAGHLLMLRRADVDHGTGCWSVPGGWVDWGETPEDAVVRELWEEARLFGTGPRLAGVVSNTYEEQQLHVVCLFYNLGLVGLLPSPVNQEPDKHSFVGWVALDDVPSRIPQFPPFRSFLESR